VKPDPGTLAGQSRELGDIVLYITITLTQVCQVWFQRRVHIPPQWSQNPRPIDSRSLGRGRGPPPSSHEARPELSTHQSKELTLSFFEKPLHRGWLALDRFPCFPASSRLVTMPTGTAISEQSTASPKRSASAGFLHDSSHERDVSVGTLTTPRSADTACSRSATSITEKGLVSVEQRCQGDKCARRIASPRSSTRSGRPVSFLSTARNLARALAASKSTSIGGTHRSRGVPLR
jgi:hypothetical protein